MNEHWDDTLEARLILLILSPLILAGWLLSFYLARRRLKTRAMQKLSKAKRDQLARIIASGKREL